jgi:hypothetical protein
MPFKSKKSCASKGKASSSGVFSGKQREGLKTRRVYHQTYNHVVRQEALGLEPNISQYINDDTETQNFPTQPPSPPPPPPIDDSPPNKTLKMALRGEQVSRGRPPILDRAQTDLEKADRKRRRYLEQKQKEKTSAARRLAAQKRWNKTAVSMSDCEDSAMSDPEDSSMSDPEAPLMTNSTEAPAASAGVLPPISSLPSVSASPSSSDIPSGEFQDQANNIVSYNY